MKTVLVMGVAFSLISFSAPAGDLKNIGNAISKGAGDAGDAFRSWGHRALSA